MAELAGVAQVKFGINAFAKIDVGVWLFKGTVWRKDWTLAEWIWNTGLNIALRANVSYTLGDAFAPDISFETGQVDPEKFIKDVMPESGTPVPAPPKPPVPEKGGFTAEGTAGKQEAGAAAGAAPPAPKPGAAPAKTQAGQAPGPKAGGPPTSPGAQPAGTGLGAQPPAAQPQDPAARENAWKLAVQGVKSEIDILEGQEVDSKIIQSHLPTWQTKFGFKQLTLQTKEDEWIIEGAMSPAKTVDKVPRKPIKPKGDGKDYQRILDGKLLDLTNFMNPPGLRLRIDPNYISPKDPKGRTNAERARSLSDLPIIMR